MEKNDQEQHQYELPGFIRLIWHSVTLWWTDLVPILIGRDCRKVSKPEPGYLPQSRNENLRFKLLLGRSRSEDAELLCYVTVNDAFGFEIYRWWLMLVRPSHITLMVELRMYVHKYTVHLQVRGCVAIAEVEKIAPLGRLNLRWQGYHTPANGSKRPIKAKSCQRRIILSIQLKILTSKMKAFVAVSTHCLGGNSSHPWK